MNCGNDRKHLTWKLWAFPAMDKQKGNVKALFSRQCWVCSQVCVNIRVKAWCLTLYVNRNDIFWVTWNDFLAFKGNCVFWTGSGEVEGSRCVVSLAVCNKFSIDKWIMCSQSFTREHQQAASFRLVSSSHSYRSFFSSYDLTLKW